jgi:hypothetical protein
MNPGAGLQLLTPVIPATQEEEIRRITVEASPKQIVLETLPLLGGGEPSQKRTGGVAQGVVSEFKPQYQKEKEKKKKE